MKSFFLTILALTGLAFGQADTSLLPQDYKCGISIRYGGTEGVDYVAEEHFFEPRANNRRTIYLRDTTTITLFHNALNSLAHGAGYNQTVGAAGPDNIAGNADDGRIRYKLGGDLSDKYIWAERLAPTYRWPALIPNPIYSAPLTFATMTYPGGLSVVGRTGSNGQPITSSAAYFHYGVLDSAGDEWHTLCIADDDQAYCEANNKKEEYWSSDGKMQAMVVNPKTPCLSVTKTGNGQFYTTPAKTYFIPVIHAQTTYIQPGSGTISVKMTDLYGGVVQYRINGGSWTNNGTNQVTLADSAFSTGANTLECRYAATPAVIRTRAIVKNPPFPSAGEAHGNLLWANATEYNQIVPRLSTPQYSWFWNKNKNDRDTNFQSHWDLNGWRGVRRPQYGVHPASHSKAFENAFVAKVQGWDAKRAEADTRTYARYAKEMLLDNALNLDPVGTEHSPVGQSNPSTEFRGGGYYMVNLAYGTIPAYDILIAEYRSDQHADGITPIEDFFIRDQLAGWVWRNLVAYRFSGGPGLWTTAESGGAFMAALAMPDYDTPYYGTSGYNGTTPATRLWTPFPNEAITWKQHYTDLLPASGVHPNRAYPFGPDRPDNPYQLLGNTGAQTGYFHGPNLGYWGLMSLSYSVITNLSELHTTRDWPVITQAYLYSVTGTFRGLLGAGPIQDPFTVGGVATGSYNHFYQVINSRHPTIVGPGRQSLVDRGYPTMTNMYELLWYDNGSTITQVAAPTFTPPAGTYNNTQTVTISSATGGATIRYTTNGTTPTISGGTVYSAPVSVPATATLKAIAYNGVDSPSTVTTANYIINVDVVIPPPTGIPGVRFQGGKKVGKDSMNIGN